MGAKLPPERTSEGDYLERGIISHRFGRMTYRVQRLENGTFAVTVEHEDVSAVVQICICDREFNAEHIADALHEKRLRIIAEHQAEAKV